MSKLVKPLNNTDEIAMLAPVMATAFCLHDPLAIKINVGEAIFTDFVSGVAAASFADNISCLVHDAKTGAVIGGSVCHLLSNQAVEEATFPLIQPALDVLGLLKAPPYVNRVDPRLVAHLFLIGGLSPEEGGQKGISEATVIYTIEAAKRKGVRYIISELGSPVTQHVCIDKHGFKVEDKIIYGDCGIPEFEGVPGNAVMGVLDLTTQK